MSELKNLFEPVDFSKKPEEFIEILFNNNNKLDEFLPQVRLLKQGGMRIERIVSQGHVSPKDFWYDQDEGEWVAVLQGEAELEFKDYKIKLNSGDYIFIKPHELHRVIYTSSQPQCVWLAVFIK